MKYPSQQSSRYAYKLFLLLYNIIIIHKKYHSDEKQIRVRKNEDFKKFEKSLTFRNLLCLTKIKLFANNVI